MDFGFGLDEDVAARAAAFAAFGAEEGGDGVQVGGEAGGVRLRGTLGGGGGGFPAVGEEGLDRAG